MKMIHKHAKNKSKFTLCVKPHTGTNPPGDIDIVYTYFLYSVPIILCYFAVE